jgi:hypothetical protein
MTMRRAIIVGIAALLIISATGVFIVLFRSRIISSRFDTDAFDSPNYKLALCFDLRDEDHMMSGLVINSKPDLPKGQHIVLLPFSSVEAQHNIKLLTTWGSYNNLSVITYIASDRIGASNGIGIIPKIPVYTLDEINSGANSHDFVYLIRAGVERKFIYKYPTSIQEIGYLAPEIQSLPFDNIDSIAVIIPPDAEFREVRPGYSEIPTNEYTNGKARFYTTSAERAGSDHIELRYAFKATSSQTFFVEMVIKFIAVIFVPLVSLIALRPEEVENPSTRKRLIWGGVILQVLIIGGLVIYIWVTHQPGESEVKAIGDAAITVLGAILGAVALIVKVKK